MTDGYMKSLPEIVHELKGELKDFVATRVAMLRGEMTEKWSSVKMSLPGLVAGLVMLGTGWLLFTALLVAIVATAFSGKERWVYAFLIVGGVYVLLGAMLAMMAWTRLKGTHLLPERTIKVLKQDEVWLETEARISYEQQ